MTAAPSKLLLDTNVWLDLFAGDRPGRREAMELVSWATEQEATLLYAASSVKDLHYVLEWGEKRRLREDGREITPAAAAAISEYAWGCIRSMGDIAALVPVDQSDFWLAVRYRAVHPDFEDNLVLAAAERAKADLLVTSDKDLLRRSPVAALAPRDVLALVRA